MTKIVKFQVFCRFQDPLGGIGRMQKIFKKYFSYSLRCLLIERFMKCRILMNLAFTAYRLGQKT